MPEIRPHPKVIAVPNCGIYENSQKSRPQSTGRSLKLRWGYECGGDRWGYECGGWATTRSSQVPGQQAGSVHPMEKLCSHFLLYPKNITERARGQEGRQGVGGRVRTSCKDTQINTNCIKHTRSGKASALGVPREEVLGIKVLWATGPAVQGRRARAPSPAVPQP